MKNDYAQWNRVLAEYCLLSIGADEQACLCVSPNVLAAAWAQHQTQELSGEEAERRFIVAVANEYRREALYAGLEVFSREGDDGLPRSIALLGLSVLAAFKMQRDDNHAAHAYYSRLADLLGCGQEGDYPRGFRPSEFKRLWMSLRDWLNDSSIQLALPERDSGVGHIRDIPLSHVPLRQIDLNKLPKFFSSFSYLPGSRTSRFQLERDFRRWLDASSHLTVSGVAAFRDERSGVVMTQVVQEIEAWDGLVTEAGNADSADVELQLEFVRRHPQVSYLPRRPRAFPEIFTTNTLTFESCDEGWYDPVPVPREDGSLLAQGLAWSALYGERTLTLHRRGANAIALVPSQLQSGYVSRKRLLLNVKCAVLCLADIADEVASYLNEVTGCRCESLDSQDLPRGWLLFRDIVPVHPILAPPQLEAIDVEVETNIIPVGGLRISRRRWIVGAPPHIFVSGGRGSEERPTINGEEVDVDADGRLIDEGRLAAIGAYTIAAGRGKPEHIEVVEPDVPHSDDAETTVGRPSGAFVALPPGRWTLIGAAFNEILHCTSQSSHGVVVRAPFRAVWAVSRSQTLNAKIVCLDTSLPSPTPLSVIANPVQLQLAGQWATVAHTPNSPHPRIGCLTAITDADKVHKVWREYAAVAHSLTYSSLTARRRLA